MSSAFYSRNDWIRVATLIAVAAGIRFWLLAHTEVSARDSIGFMREALQFEERPWREVLRSFDQMPGYPLAVLLVSKPIRAMAGTNCDSFVLSAQLASILASLLTIVPMYFTGKMLFGRNAGLVAAGMFQALPVCVQVTSDGLSEGVFFLFVASALFFAVFGIRRSGIASVWEGEAPAKPSAQARQEPRPPKSRHYWRSSSWCFLISGAGIGLAYLTRPEGGELAIAIGGVVAVHAIAARTWKMPARQLAALALGIAPFVATYAGVTGKLTRKPTSLKMLEGEPAAAVNGGPVLFATFWNDQLQEGQSRSRWASLSLIRESGRSTHYYGFALAAAGVWLLRRTMQRDPAAWTLLALAGLHALVLWRMATVSGYLSERHTMILAFVTCFWCGGAVAAIGERLHRVQWSMATALLAIFALGLPSILKPLHANRAGHRQAGIWLAANATGKDEVIDPFCWAHFYAGCVFRESQDPPPPQHVRYVVIEQSDNSHARLMMIDESRQLAKAGVPVYHWPESKPVEQAKVVVYRVGPAGNEPVVKN